MRNVCPCRFLKHNSILRPQDFKPLKYKINRLAMFRAHLYLHWSSIMRCESRSLAISGVQSFSESLTVWLFFLTICLRVNRRHYLILAFQIFIKRHPEPEGTIHQTHPQHLSLMMGCCLNERISDIHKHFHKIRYTRAIQQRYYQRKVFLNDSTNVKLSHRETHTSFQSSLGLLGFCWPHIHPEALLRC